MKKSNSKKIVVILLFSLITSGCSQKHIMHPIDYTSIQQAQKEYEYIPKPIAYTKPSTEIQKENFKSNLRKTFSDIDRYKHKLKEKYKKYKNAHFGVRYGKNKLPVKKIENTLKQVELYPKMKTGKHIKHSALYGVE